MDKVLVENRGDFPSDVFEPIRCAVESHRTMERALAWFFAHAPALTPDDLIPQDEFSYDLLVPMRSGLLLSYAVS